MRKNINVSFFVAIMVVSVLAFTGCGSEEAGGQSRQDVVLLNDTGGDTIVLTGDTTPDATDTTELPDGEQDPCDEVDCQESACCAGICINTNDDSLNCGACGNACENADVCCEGSCADTMTDTNNCGGCGVECDDGQDCCGGSCVDLQTDESHCGACGAVCADSEGCCGGDCIDVVSDAENCGACGLVCEEGCMDRTCTCGGVPTDIANDPLNCGACGEDCNGLPFVDGVDCTEGVCVVLTCQAEFANCDGDPSNGCETHLMGTDATNCGGCGVTCDSCTDGQCGCGGVPTDVLNDPMNCGVCGNECSFPNADGVTCNNGICGLASCAAGFEDCNADDSDGCEIDLTTDPDNCASCGNSCEPDPSLNVGTFRCFQSECGLLTCADGFNDCDGDFLSHGENGTGCETSTSDNDQNCGGCNIVCASGMTCVDGSCQ